MRYVYIFCGAFVAFFLVGGFTEYQARKKITDHDFLLEIAASRFDYLPYKDQSKVQDFYHKLYYRCGDHFLYSLNLDTGVLQAEELRSLGPPHVESLTHEEIALLASGWGLR